MKCIVIKHLIAWICGMVLILLFAFVLANQSMLQILQNVLFLFCNSYNEYVMYFDCMPKCNINLISACFWFNIVQSEL